MYLYTGWPAEDIHARWVLSNHASLLLDYPGGEMAEAIAAAGFKPRRTLIWMRT